MKTANVIFENPSHIERMRVIDGPFQHSAYGWAYQVAPLDGKLGSVIVPETRVSDIQESAQ